MAIAAMIASRTSAATMPPIASPIGLCNRSRSVDWAGGFLGTSAAGVMATCGPERTELDGAAVLIAGIAPLAVLPPVPTTCCGPDLAVEPAFTTGLGPD